MRTVQYVVTFILLLMLNFFLPRMMPGDPIAALMGDPAADAPLVITEEMRQQLLAYYGLDQPLWKQFVDYVIGIFTGDWGWSISRNAPVRSVLMRRLGWTLFLSGSATAIYVTIGILLGAFSAWERGKKVDAGLLISVFSLGSWPPFFLGMLLVILFGFRLGWFPIGGARAATPLAGFRGLVDVLHHWALPCFCLVISHVAGVYLLVRNSMVGVLQEPYIQTAHAKGLRSRRTLFRHALPNALLPVVTAIAMRFGFLLVGAVAVEVVFAYPGMGTLLYEAGVARDYPLLQGAFLLLTFFVLFFNFVADLLYRRLDPRVREMV